MNWCCTTNRNSCDLSDEMINRDIRPRSKDSGPYYHNTRSRGSRPTDPFRPRRERLCVRAQRREPLPSQVLIHRLQQHCLGPKIHKHSLEDRSAR